MIYVFVHLNVPVLAPSQAPGNLMGIQDGDRVSLGWEAVKPLDNESDVMGYKVRDSQSLFSSLFPMFIAICLN